MLLIVLLFLGIETGWFVHEDELPSDDFEKKGQNDFDFPMVSTIKGLFLDDDPLFPFINSIFLDSCYDGFSHATLDFALYTPFFELRSDMIEFSLVPWDIKHQWL